MKIIITEEQNEKVNRKIRLTVEKLGLEQAREILGDELIKQGYKDDPLLFLEQFNNLKLIEKNDRIYYVDKDDHLLFFYLKDQQVQKIGYYWINYDRIWLFFDEVMGFGYYEIEEIITKWLGTTYNLRGLTPVPSKNLFRGVVGNNL